MERLAAQVPTGVDYISGKDKETLTLQPLPSHIPSSHVVDSHTAVSLIFSIQRLHKAGILHCDINSANLAWDSKTRLLVSLLDIDHAQLRDDATSYKGTRGFSAP